MQNTNNGRKKDKLHVVLFNAVNKFGSLEAWGKKKCIYNFDRKSSRGETTFETSTEMET
jgi:hypothetical protein